MSEKIEAPATWPFAPGDEITCGLQFDQDEALDAAPVGTVVQNAEACEWTRGVHGWFGAHPSWATSADLVEHGPLTVVSVPTLHACTVDETAGRAEPTGAVERAAEAILEACYGQELPEAPIDLARAALTAALDVDELARVDAETTRCSWSIPQDGHPYNESCLYKRDRIDGQVSHGACWDAPYARATAICAALLGGAA